MKKYYFVFLLGFLLTACIPTPVATPNPAEVALTMFADKVKAEATQAAVNSVFTATAQVIAVTSTQQAAQTQQAITEQARRDANATADQARVDLANTQQVLNAISTAEQARADSATSTAEAGIAIARTQSADATATFTVMTLTAMPGVATATQIAINNQMVVDAQDVEKSGLELQQARDTNRISWQAPLLIAVAAIGMALLWVIRKSRWNVITDGDGNVEGFGFDEQFVRPNLLPGPVLDLKAKSMPQLTDSATQKEIVVNDQKIRALAAMPVQPTASGAALFNGFGNEQEKKSMPVIEVVRPDQVGSQILEEIEGKVVEEG